MKYRWTTTTRKDGDAKIAARLRQILECSNWPTASATATQVHGTRVQVIQKGGSKAWPSTDGLLTDAAQVPLGIYTADCLPIFLVAPKVGVVGLLHAGWRGLHAGILKEALRQLRQRWLVRPADVHVWSGPCIQACCFEVGWDVARRFPGARRFQKGHWFVDLPAAFRRQAQRLGIRVKSGSRDCTRHQKKYFSYRRDQGQERQISLIMKRNAS